MKRLACVGGFMFASFLGSAFAAAQIPSPEHVYVLRASPRQATTTAPLTLTFSEPIRQGKKSTLRQIEITIPAGDVIDSLTTRVRAQKFEYDTMREHLFVLDVRGRSLPRRSRDPLLLTLASGAVVAVPPGCVHDAATNWLRSNLSAPKAVASELAKPDPGRRADECSGPAVQFDPKGVDYSSWLRRFMTHVRRNWVIPESAKETKGCVVVTFRVHKNGAITNITLAAPSSADVLNNSALNAVTASNPTIPLPPEYSEEYAVFTITFYFNDTPPR